MKIEQKTLGGFKEYRLSGAETEPMEIFINGIFAQFPTAGYGTYSSGTRWNDMSGRWEARITHSLTCD